MVSRRMVPLLAHRASMQVRMPGWASRRMRLRGGSMAAVVVVLVVVGVGVGVGVGRIAGIREAGGRRTGRGTGQVMGELWDGRLLVWYWSWTVLASRASGVRDHWIGKLVLVGLLGFWRWAR